MSEVKAKQVLDLLGEGSVLIQVNHTIGAADLPKHLRGKDSITLKIGWDLTPSIPDLAVTERGIRGTMTFKGSMHLCVIPWCAIFAAAGANDSGFVWAENAPTSALLEAATRTARQMQVVRLDTSKKPSGRRVGPSLAPKTTFLRVINGGKS